MNKYTQLATAPVPQTEALNERQVQNNAGGFVFQLDDFARLQRFLILGSSEPTYYQKAKDLTRENAKCVERCYAQDADRTVATISNVSVQGRAPKNDAAIFALALGAAHADLKVRQAALGALQNVCRTATHLFQFVDCTRTLGKGWGRGLKRAVAAWYNSKDVDAVGYQAIKYRLRESYTHKRLMQTAHPTANTGRDKSKRIALYRWTRGLEVDVKKLPDQVQAHLQAMASDKPGDWSALARKHNLPWEALPTEANARPEVWAALLPKMGLTALVRNLGNMSRIGTIKPLSEAEDIVVARLANAEDLRKSRLHPFSILQAMAVYKSGHGMRGSGIWDVSQRIVAALDDAFYKSFANVEPANKRTLIGLDVSGSMSSPMGGSALSVAEAAAAMCMVTARTEPKCHIFGFAQTFRDLGITARDSLDDVLTKTTRQNFGSTDCSLPMIYASQKDIEVDTFCVYTDNETFAGHSHPVQELAKYRKKTGIKSKLIVVGMTSTEFTIADSQDGGMLDCVGFDSSAPAVMAEFSRS